MARMPKCARSAFSAQSTSLLTGFLCLVLLTGAPTLWATPGLGFGGLVQTLSTGSIALSGPSDMTVDSSGNIYIADTDNNQIVEVNAQGSASVLAISGLSPALNLPVGVAVDGAGNLYIADTGNNRVVEVSPTGTGSVISMGSVTLNSPRRVAVDQSGDIFISDAGNNRIVEVPSGGSAAVINITGLGTALNTPVGLAVGNTGNLYIADSGNNRIVTVAAGGTAGTVLAIAGQTLSAPKSIAVDGLGNIFIADSNNNRIVMVDTSGNGLVMSSGSATFSQPRGVALDVFGTVYVADTGNNRTLAVDLPVNPALASGDPGYSLNKSAVGFGHVQLGSSTPVSITLPFTIGSTTLGSVEVFTTGTQNLDFSAGAGTTCVASISNATCSVNIVYLPTAPGLRSGAVVFYDGSTPPNPILTIPLYAFSDSPVAALAPNTGSVINTGNLALSNPFQLALDGSGNIYAGNYSSKNVTKITAGGGSASAVNLGTPGSIAVQNITGVALDGAGNLFIGDHQNSRILVVTPAGVVSVLTIAGVSPSLGFPVALAFDGAGNLYISDFTQGRVIKVTSLQITGSASAGVGTVLPTGSYSFSGSTLTGMTVDRMGTIYIAARTENNSSIIKVTAAGVASVLAIPNNITPALSNPQGVGVDGMGNIYIVDSGNNRIVEITTAGVASVLNISGLPAPSGLSSLLFGVTADPSGNLYIPDWTNNRIVFVNVSGASMTFASTDVGSTSSDSPKTATVTNLGNMPLIFSANPSYTANFSNNSGDTNPCTSSTSLSSGTTCDVSVNFTPQSAGSLNAGVTVTNNTLNVPGSTQQVSVSGTGVAVPDATAVVVAATPSSVIAGQATTITATVADTVSGHSATVPAGNVTFTDMVGSTAVSLNGGNAVTSSGGVATLTGVILSGVGTHTITANFAANSSFLASSNTTTVTVGNQITPTITWAQPNAILVGTSLTGILNATAANGGSSVAGTFAYAGTLQGGSPTALTTATVLTAGSYTLTATFTPTDTTTYKSATDSVSLTVQDFALNISTGSTTSATVQPGGTATFTLMISPSSGTTFDGPIALSASGLPSGATATFTPQSIATGAGTTTVTLTIQTASVAANQTSHTLVALAISPGVFGMLLLPFAGRLRRRTSKFGRIVCLLLAVSGASMILGLAGCGSTAPATTTTQQPQSYVVTVTGASGSVSRTTTVNLSVQ